MKKRYIIGIGALCLTVVVAGLFRGQPLPKTKPAEVVQKTAPAVEDTLPQEITSQSLTRQIGELKVALLSSEQNIARAQQELHEQNELLKQLNEVENDFEAGRLSPEKYLQRRREIGGQILP